VLKQNVAKDMVYTRSKEVAMRHMRMLIVLTAMAFVAAGSARGVTSPGPLLLDRTAVTASGLSPLPVMKGDESLSKTIVPAAWNSTVAPLFVAASAQATKAPGKADDGKEKKPPPRSKRCPPDPKDDPSKKDHRDDKCGKGNDSQSQ
jgi:hypothetical protein